MPLPLRVVGTQILNGKDEPVRLCGVNCASLERTSDGQGPRNATWWTAIPLGSPKSSPSTRRLAWVLVWRNADLRQNYAAFPRAATVDDFKAFEADPLTLFMEDLPQMYESDDPRWSARPKRRVRRQTADLSILQSGVLRLDDPEEGAD